MIDEGTLWKRAREAVETGKLPNRRPTCMWGGSGVGASCAICEDPLEPDELEYEVEFDQIDGSAASQGYHIHVRCYAAWELERHILMSDTGQLALVPAGTNSGASGNGTSCGILLFSEDSGGGTISDHECHPGGREARIEPSATCSTRTRARIASERVSGLILCGLLPEEISLLCALSTRLRTD